MPAPPESDRLSLCLAASHASLIRWHTLRARCSLKDFYVLHPQKHILYVFSRMAGSTVVFAAAGHSRRRRVGDLGHSGARCDASGRQEPPIADRGNRTVQLEKNGSVTYGESPFVRKMSSPRTFVSLQGRPSRSAL